MDGVTSNANCLVFGIGDNMSKKKECPFFVRVWDASKFLMHDGKEHKEPTVDLSLKYFAKLYVNHISRQHRTPYGSVKHFELCVDEITKMKTSAYVAFETAGGCPKKEVRGF